MELLLGEIECVLDNRRHDTGICRADRGAHEQDHTMHSKQPLAQQSEYSQWNESSRLSKELQFDTHHHHRVWLY